MKLKDSKKLKGWVIEELVMYSMKRDIEVLERIQFLQTITSTLFITKGKLEKRE